ncbi:MAG: 6-bladed beta-propeller [Gemmatimonadetes bacterium]|nr:6-bladed beta-propeller [Gemmatimonadota bacterium]MYH51505.1 6-bladed beta-propeller [Gemmatimonadota bacterium]MYK64926.1 6-bladed beta-propeller [Gemmatimonadota bacterium]
MLNCKEGKDHRVNMADPGRLPCSRFSHGRPVTVFRRGALPLVLLQSVACAGDQSSTGEHPSTTWITEAEHQFGDAPERGVFFSRPYVRSDPTRNRVFVLDAVNSQVSAWTDRGSLLFAVGRRGEGPGEFGFPQDMFIDADGSFAVLDNSGVRFTYYAANGQLIETESGMNNAVSYQGLGLAVTFPLDGTYLGVVRANADLEAGIDGLPPFVRQPLLSVRRSGTGQWEIPRPVLWLDVSNRIRVLKHPDGNPSYGSQPFGDADQFRLERGAAVVMRLKEAPGAVELVEVSGEGDTVWHRRLSFEPRRLTSGMVEQEIEEAVDILAPDAPQGMSRPVLRDALSESLYRPQYLPAAEGPPVLTASGEVWLKTYEVSDTLRTHYVVRRGESDEVPRRLLLPEWFRVRDATATHVWGVWWDAMDRPHVVGRRLVPLNEG